MNWLNLIAVVVAVLSVGATPGNAQAGTAKRAEKSIKGNYEMNLVLTGSDGPRSAKVFISGNEELSKHAFLEISDDSFKIARQTDDGVTVWKEQAGVGKPPWKVKVLKKGNFFRFWVNDATGWIRGPLGEWEKVYEPVENSVGVEATEGLEIQSCTVTTLPWLQQINDALITRGPKGSFYEKQIIPGAILEYEGRYYLYFMAGMEGNQEGSSRRTIGVVISDDLENWHVHPEPLISYEDSQAYDNIYVNGAVVAPDGKIAVIFSAQKFPEWVGFMLATAENPIGPFTLSPKPVYKHFAQAHEFDLIQVDHPDYRYILFYAGYTPEPRRGMSGDRGYLIYSDDLVTWRADERNPVFGPEAVDDWDSVHMRPRSLNRIGDTWYLWYEGCNNWKPEGSSHHGWWDTVGLARSKDLHNWERYPRNPTLPGLGVNADQFDSNWVGWPRMLIKDNLAYVFYTGNGQTGLRTIPVDELTNWESENGKTFDLLD